MNVINTDKIKLIFEKAVIEAVEIIEGALRRQTELIAVNPEQWITAEQLAERWNLYGTDGKPTTASIYKWTKRSMHPLPHARMGDLIRFRCEDVDGWARDEAIRQRDLKQLRSIR